MARNQGGKGFRHDDFADAPVELLVLRLNRCVPCRKCCALWVGGGDDFRARYVVVAVLFCISPTFLPCGI